MALGQKTRRDLMGQRFNRLTVIAFDHIDHNRQARWLCRCDCGKIISTIGNSLVRNLTKSCGCLKLENFIKSHRWKNPPHTIKHGHAIRGKKSKEYHTWLSMLDRCRSLTARYAKNYRKRGIVLLEPRWINFEEFLKDVGPAPSLKHSLDRIDNNSGYGPQNCRWATKKQQCRNTRRNRVVTFNGEALTISDWAERTGLARHIITYRLNHGWPIDKAFTQPVHHR